MTECSENCMEVQLCQCCGLPCTASGGDIEAAECSCECHSKVMPL